MAQPRGIVNAFDLTGAGQAPEQEDEMARVYGPQTASALRTVARAMNLANPLSPLPQFTPPTLGPTAQSIANWMFPEQQPSMLQLGADVSKQPPNLPGMLQFGQNRDLIKGQQQPSSGGGGSSTFQGIPLPQAPQLQAPDVDIGKLFDPIMAQLQDPKKIEGPSMIGGLAQILGGAAAGAQRGLNVFQQGGTGSVIAGAGAGAAEAGTDLRREEQVLEMQFQESLQRMQQARAGVLSNKAGAEIDLAQAVADTKNKQSELQFNRDVQASMQSQQQVQPLGDGRVMVQRFDPNTGQGTMNILDTRDAHERMLEQAYIMSQIEKNMRAGTSSKNEPRIVLDGKEIRRSALFASANTVYSDPLQKDAEEATFRALDSASVKEAYRQELEEWLTENGSATLIKDFEDNPDFVLSRYIFEKMLQDPGERAAIRGLSQQKGTTPAPSKEPTLGEMFGPGPSKY